MTDTGAELHGVDIRGVDRHRVQMRMAQWWRRSARDLPWRFGRTTPWGVLVSEVMSQQTQMSRVVPYWLMWMRVWPDAPSLAAASSAEVITAWGRLGYPRRALRLQQCARAVTHEYRGRLPDDYGALVALPGIGDYTASALLAFAFHRRVVVLDTNIRRVFTRVFEGRESLGGAPTRGEREVAASVLPRDAEASVSWNQAVMELGALVCTAKRPQCDACPLAVICRFYQAGLPGLAQRRTRPRQHFQGTDRQVRGIVLDALRGEPAGTVLDRTRLRELWEDHAQLDACITSLDEDGLIEIRPGGAVSLPW